MLIIGDCESWKLNRLRNLISHQLDIHKFFLYTKEPFEAKHQFFINKRESVGFLRGF